MRCCLSLFCDFTFRRTKEMSSLAASNKCWAVMKT